MGYSDQFLGCSHQSKLIHLFFYRTVSAVASLSKQWDYVKYFLWISTESWGLDPKNHYTCSLVDEVCQGELILERMVLIINTSLWGDIEKGLSVDGKFIWLQYNMAAEKGHCNLMLLTEKLYQRGRRELRKSANANSTWNSIFSLLARMYCWVGVMHRAAKYLGNI